MQEIKLNKDLNKIQENVFMGLTLRQSIWGGIGLALGTAVYFYLTRRGISSDVSTVAVAIVVAPFAALGFVNYHGMPFERIVRALIKQFILCPKRLVYRHENHFYEKDKHHIKTLQELEAKINDEDTQNSSIQ